MNVKVALIVSAVVFAAPLRAEVQVSSWRVGVVADPSLSRVAQGVQDSASPYVRVNPILAQRVPFDIALFTIAHEQAHLVLGHVLDGDDEESILAADSGSVNGRRVGRRTLELAADCAAAQYIVSKSPGLLATIIQRFLAMAEEHPDEEAIDGPPTLRERAKVLRDCGSARKVLRAG